MATITLIADPATFEDGFVSVAHRRTPLARKSVWVVDVRGASAELDAFVAEVRATHRGGFQACALWPSNKRKPRGWDAAWNDKVLCRHVRPAEHVPAS